jgi:hypothetical protein
MSENEMFEEFGKPEPDNGKRGRIAPITEGRLKSRDDFRCQVQVPKATMAFGYGFMYEMNPIRASAVRDECANLQDAFLKDQSKDFIQKAGIAKFAEWAKEKCKDDYSKEQARQFIKELFPAFDPSVLF